MNNQLWVLRGATGNVIGKYKTERGLMIALGKIKYKLFDELESIRKENPEHTLVYSFKLESI